MAVTLNVVEQAVTEEGYISFVDVTGPASYTTGGEVLTAAQVNQLMPRLGGGAALADVSKIQFVHSETGPGGHSVAIDRTNQKVLFFIGPQVAGSTNLGTTTVRIRVKYGKTLL